MPGLYCYAGGTGSLKTLADDTQDAVAFRVFDTMKSPWSCKPANCSLAHASPTQTSPIFLEEAAKVVFSHFEKSETSWHFSHGECS